MIEIDIEKFVIERAIQGLTREELAEKSGVGTSTISKLETGKANPRLVTVVKLAKGLGKNLEHFRKN